MCGGSALITPLPLVSQPQTLLASIAEPTETTSRLIANVWGWGVVQDGHGENVREFHPNPFNPETWIPFELSQDTEVTVGIMMYRASGYGNYI